ncbi:GntR family transcriptional regulator [Alicyclobacillaceae bacterium I2511]|nr:GntR family transcriptional regulator [Alicyclobacillaceae bacterium I2511]
MLVYQQIVDRIKAAVVKGFLNSADRLPSVRELAVQLTLNHNTVAKAYQELEREGVIEVIRGRGTFIAAQDVVPNMSERLQSLRTQLERLVVEGHHLHLANTDLHRLLDEVTAPWAGENPEWTPVPKRSTSENLGHIPSVIPPRSGSTSPSKSDEVVADDLSDIGEGGNRHEGLGR